MGLTTALYPDHRAHSRSGQAGQVPQAHPGWCPRSAPAAPSAPLHPVAKATLTLAGGHQCPLLISPPKCSSTPKFTKPSQTSQPFSGCPGASQPQPQDPPGTAHLLAPASGSAQTHPWDTQALPSSLLLCLLRLRLCLPGLGLKYHLHRSAHRADPTVLGPTPWPTLSPAPRRRSNH